MMNVFTPPRGVTDRTARDRVIVGCGIGAHYRERIRSTINHCDVYCPDTWKLWYDELPAGCPPHQINSPYAFKIHALQQALDAGFRYALWMDTSFQPVASIEPLWKHIEHRGFYAGEQGDAKLGEWCSDEALRIFRMGRDVAMTIPLLYSGLVGFDLHGPGRQIFLAWKGLEAKAAFAGPHFNDAEFSVEGHKWRGPCSLDPRCKGHRHDESALSYVAHAYSLFVGRTGFTKFESSMGGFIGHMVPDYDLPEMRLKLLEYSNVVQDGYVISHDEWEDIRTLCR